MSKIDADTIVRTAWALVDRGGLNSFSLRTVARELGVTPMAIYHHVDNKADLARLMVEAANGALPAMVAGQSWKDGLWAVAMWHWNNRLAHPALGELQRSYKVFTLPLLKASERWIGLWLQSGLERDQALMAAKASSIAINGLVDEEATSNEATLPDETVLSLSPDTRHLFETDGPSVETYELAVRALIEGLFIYLSK